MRNMKQNLGFAFVYNALGIPLAAGVLYPGHRLAAVADDRGAGDEPELGVGDHERTAPARRARSLIGFRATIHSRPCRNTMYDRGLLP